MMHFPKTHAQKHAKDKSSAAIIAEMQTYLQQFLETPHPQFGGLHICPFFKKARLQKKIEYYVHPFSSVDLAANSDLLQRIKQFGRDRQKQVFLCIHPIKQGISFTETDYFVQLLNPLIQDFDLVAFGGHPDDPFNVNGVYTRVTPYVNFTVQFKADLTAATKALLQTNYYKHWSPENLKYIGFPRDGV